MIGKILIMYGLFTFLCVPAGFLAGLFVCRVFGDTYWYLTAVELAGFAGMMADMMSLQWIMIGSGFVLTLIGVFFYLSCERRQISIKL